MSFNLHKVWQRSLELENLNNSDSINWLITIIRDPIELCPLYYQNQLVLNKGWFFLAWQSRCPPHCQSCWWTPSWCFQPDQPFTARCGGFLSGNHKITFSRSLLNEWTPLNQWWRICLLIGQILEAGTSAITDFWWPFWKQHIFYFLTKAKIFFFSWFCWKHVGGHLLELLWNKFSLKHTFFETNRIVK